MNSCYQQHNAIYGFDVTGIIFYEQIQTEPTIVSIIINNKEILKELMKGWRTTLWNLTLGEIHF